MIRFDLREFVTSVCAVLLLFATLELWRHDMTGLAVIVGAFFVGAVRLKL